MSESVHCPQLDPNLHTAILERSLAYLGLPKNYSRLGGRTCGSAYLSNGKVYKITTDKSEAIESKKIIGKKNTHLVDIYDVKKVNNTLTDVNVYLIVMEHLRTDREPIFGEIEDALINLFDRELGIHLFDLIYYYRFQPSFYKNQYEQDVNAILGTHQREKYYYKSLLDIINELKNNGIESIDVQYHNLGLKPNGNVAFFDLGFGDHNGKVSNIRVNERVTTYMKNSKAVGIKKKCVIGGNGDGTSTACNQGDINNIELKSITEGQDKKIEYGALMLDFEVKKWKEITDIIEPDDIYDKPTFGIENNPHVTILYGLHENVKINDVKSTLKDKYDLKKDIEIELIGISHFDTPNYDVVKFDVKSKTLIELNKEMKKLPHTSSYPNYHPHMTISYVKKGTGKKYKEKFDETIKLKSNKIVYSNANGSKNYIN